MKAEEIKKAIYEFVNEFAKYNPDGTWWGHDTDLGTCEEHFNKLESIIHQAQVQVVEKTLRYLDTLFNLPTKDHQWVRECLSKITPEVILRGEEK